MSAPIPINAKSPGRGRIKATIECAVCPERLILWDLTSGLEIDDALVEAGWEQEEYDLWYCPEHAYMARESNGQ